MIPFRTTPEQVLKLATIIPEMQKAGVDRNLIVAADKLARIDQGIFDLMTLWATDRAERDEVIADIQESIDDWTDYDER